MLSNPICREQYYPNGSTTSFAFPSTVYSDGDMVVIITDLATLLDTTMVLTTDYTIDGSQLGQDSGIDIVFGTAPLTNTRLTLARIVSLTQNLNLPPGNTPFPSNSAEVQFDRIVMMILQQQDEISRNGLPLSTPLAQPVIVRGGDYIAYDVSTGLTPQLSFTPGNHKDSTGGQVLIPTANGTTIDTIPAPKLTVSVGDTKAYFHFKVNATNGHLDPTTKEILSGTTVPNDTSTDAYQLMTNFIVDISSGAAVITVTGGGVNGSQNYQYCGLLPATDGSGHILNS